MKVVGKTIIIEDGLEYDVIIYDNGAVSKVLHSEIEPQPVGQPISQDEINAEILLNQAQIIETQNSQDEVLAQILLNSVQ